MVHKSPFPSVDVSYEPYHLKVLQQIRRHAEKNPERKAFISAEDSSDFVTWHQLADYSHSVAGFLKERGFGRGDICCLEIIVSFPVLPNCWQYPAAFLGITMCGGAMSGASAMFTDYELERQFIDSKANSVITDEPHLEKVLVAVGNSPLIKTVICIRSTPKPIPANVFDFKEILKHSPLEEENGEFHHDDLLILPYSSGTTGSPKGVELTHKNFGTMTDIAVQHFYNSIHPEVLPGFRPDDENVLLILPFYHIYGFGLLMKSIFDGNTGVIFSKFDPILFCEKIEEYRVKQLFAVPPIIIFLAKHPAVSNYDLSSVAFVFSGAAPCGKDIAEELMKRHPTIKFLGQGYGMTECGMASHLPRPGPKSYVSAGVLASNFEQKIVNLETGEICPPNERGEIWVRGPTIMKGYLNRPEATRETVDSEGWLHTGDIGYLDEEHNLFVVDRLKELIKVKGLQVPPAELEDLLLSHPKIRDAAVIGIPDARCGEVPKAFVVRGDASLSEENVKQYVASKVSSYKHLVGGVEFLDEIPKAPSGKILRRFLRDREAKNSPIEKSKL